MRRLLPMLIGLLIIALVGFTFFIHSKNASAAITTHIVISEIQLRTVASSTDEFVELYNPTGSDVSLANWRLGRKTASGANATDLVSTMSGTIKSHGYLLIASSEYTGSTSADLAYDPDSSSISSNNSITLYDNFNSPVDLVGLGTSVASETAAIGNPANGKSVERKANSTSDATSMGSGGSDEFAGNGEDTDDNSLDFTTRNVPQPQNSQSELEPIAQTPTPSPEPSTTPTAEPSATPTVTPEPTATPIPTIEPTATPIPTSAPSLTPTSEPSPTLTPVPTVVPTVSPTPTPGGKLIVNTQHLLCTLNYRGYSVLNFHFLVPVIKCMRI